MVFVAAPDLDLEAVFLPLADVLFPLAADFALVAGFPLAEDNLEVAALKEVEDFAFAAVLAFAAVDLAEDDLPALADLLDPVAFFAVPVEAVFFAVPVDADLEMLPAFVVAAFFAPVDADLAAADFVAEAGLEAVDLVPAEVVFLVVEEADLPAAAAFLVPAALVVADFVPADLDADFVAPEVDFAAAVLLPEAVDFFAVAGLEAEDLVPLTAFMAFLAASSTAEAALEVIFFADLVTLLTMPELLLAVVFLVEVAISF